MKIYFLALLLFALSPLKSAATTSNAKLYLECVNRSSTELELMIINDPNSTTAHKVLLTRELDDIYNLGLTGNVNSLSVDEDSSMIKEAQMSFNIANGHGKFELKQLYYSSDSQFYFYHLSPTNNLGKVITNLEPQFLCTSPKVLEMIE